VLCALLHEVVIRRQQIPMTLNLNQEGSLLQKPFRMKGGEVGEPIPQPFAERVVITAVELLKDLMMEVMDLAYHQYHFRDLAQHVEPPYLWPLGEQ
jgi:hypothetical protein